MSFPIEHLHALEAAIIDHEAWLEGLKKEQLRIQTEIAVHELILRLGRDQRLMEMLGEIRGNPGLVKLLQKDPEQFLSSRGMELPDRVSTTHTVEGHRLSTISSADKSGNVLLGVVYQIGETRFGVHWDSRDGFTAAEVHGE